MNESGKVTEGGDGAEGMNEDTGRAEEVAVYSVRRKKGGKKKVKTLCRWGHRANRRDRRGCRGQQQQSSRAATRSILFRPSKILGGSVCRVAWPIVCKGSRSSSKEPAEEEEEGSEAN